MSLHLSKKCGLVYYVKQVIKSHTYLQNWRNIYNQLYV